jgi:hypothetical protein
MATEASLPTIPAKAKPVHTVDRLEALATALAFGAFGALPIDCEQWFCVHRRWPD